MSVGLLEPEVGRKKAPVKPDVMVTKIGSKVIRDARIVTAMSGEGMAEYLTRLLEPIVAKDKADAIAREGKPKR